MYRYTNRALRRDKGLSLLELLLGTTILVIMVIGTVSVLNGWLERGVNRQAAEDVGRIESAAEAFVATSFNDADVCKTADNKYKILEIQKVYDAGFIKDNYKVGSSFVTSMKQTMRVFIKCRPEVKPDATNKLAIAVPAMAEILVLTQGSRVKTESLMDAVLAGGPRIGTFTNFDGNERLAGMGNGWVVSSADITTLKGLSINTPNEEDGGYLAAYGRTVNAKSIDNRYLYRVGIDNDYTLNTMAADLNMDNNAITDIGVLTASNVVAGAVKVDVPASVAAADKPDVVALTVDGYLKAGAVAASSGVSTYGGKVQAGSLSAASANMQAGNIEVQGTTTVNGVAAVETLASSGALTVQQGATFDKLEVSGTGSKAKTLQAGTYSADTQTAANMLLVGQMTGTSEVKNVKKLKVLGNASGDAALKLDQLSLNGTLRTNVVTTPTAASNFTCKNRALSAPQCEYYTP